MTPEGPACWGCQKAEAKRACVQELQHHWSESKDFPKKSKRQRAILTLSQLNSLKTKPGLPYKFRYA